MPKFMASKILPPYDKLQMDLMYIAHSSIVEDLKIMLAMIKILFMPESTIEKAPKAVCKISDNLHISSKIWRKIAA